MEPRPYLPSDRDACLAIFDGARRDAFQSFLDAGPANYTVLEHDGRIAGCGGYSIDASQAVARLEWGIIRRDVERNGLGRFLLLYRLRQITSSAVNVTFARLTTPAQFAGFYEKQGFKRTAETGEWIDLAMKLTVCP